VDMNGKVGMEYLNVVQNVKGMIGMKTKQKGKIISKGHLIANGVQFLNGEECSRNAKVPIVLLDYETPEGSHSFAQGERFKMWIKVEGREWHTLVKQLKKDLREISIWFDEENRQKLKDFLNKEVN